MTQILPISGRRCLKKFIDFPHDLYRADPNYVPELYIAQRDLLSSGKHPFHLHSRVQLFLAYDGEDRVIGRIAAILNHNHNSFNGTSDGFFGFFDCINELQTAALLIDAASRWVKAQGATTLIGPANFSTNETCGLLISGYDSPPVVMMPYNAPYYLDLLEGAGLAKKIDLVAYQITRQTYSDKAKRMLDVLETRLRRSNIIIRKVNLKNFKEEVAKLREVYNTAWDKNLGFVAMTPEEFDYLAKDLKLILNPDFCLVAEQEGKLVGFALGIPDINQVLIKIKRGRLLPTGLVKLLLGRKKIDRIRILALGVLEGYRKLGIEACLYGHITRNWEKANMQSAECSWMLESNFLMNRAVEGINGVPYKRYRILEKAL
jgi:GNAT superfamily N-acetyltransferase